MAEPSANSQQFEYVIWRATNLNQHVIGIIIAFDPRPRWTVYDDIRRMMMQRMMVMRVPPEFGFSSLAPHDVANRAIESDRGRQIRNWIADGVFDYGMFPFYTDIRHNQLSFRRATNAAKCRVCERSNRGHWGSSHHAGMMREMNQFVDGIDWETIIREAIAMYIAEQRNYGF